MSTFVPPVTGTSATRADTGTPATTSCIATKAGPRWLSSPGAPARFSSTNSFAYSPFWMRCSASFMRWRTPASMIFGPVTYSPYSALFEIE